MLDLQGFGQLLLSGAWVTIKLALTSLVIGLILGLLGATAKMSGFKVLNAIATAYTTIIRSGRGLQRCPWHLVRMRPKLFVWHFKRFQKVKLKQRKRLA